MCIILHHIQIVLTQYIVLYIILNFVVCEKVGSMQLYWSFPSEHIQQLKNKINKATETYSALQHTKDELIEQQKELLSTRQESKERIDNKNKYNNIKQQLKQADGELDKYSVNDPVRIKKLQDGVNTCKQAANRWAGML